VRVLGEAYTPEDEEDSSVAEITAVWAYQARYRIPLTKAIAGASWLHSMPCTSPAPSHLLLLSSCPRMYSDTTPCC